MKEFKPSRNFVSRVMADVHTYEATKTPVMFRSQRFLSTQAARYALSAGGALLGIINFIRIYLALFSPALCR